MSTQHPVLEPREDGELYYEGDALAVPIGISEADGETPQNLIGATVEFIVKRDRTDPDEEALMHKSTADEGDGLEITAPDQGEVVLKIETGETDGWLDDDGQRARVRVFDWAVRVTDADGDRVTPAGLAGTWPIHAS